MSDQNDLTMLIKDQRFQSLDAVGQVNILHQALSELYGDRYLAAPEANQAEIRKIAISEATPRSWTETGLGMIPFVGPMIEQYGYNRPIRPSEITQKFISESQAREHGGFWKGVEQIGVAGAVVGVMAGLPVAAGAVGLTIPAWLAGSTAVTLPQLVTREALIGTMFEAGNFIFEPPQSREEAAIRLGAGAVGGAVIGTAWIKGGEFLANRGANRALIHEFGSLERANDVRARFNSTDPMAVSEAELAGYLRIADKYKGESGEQLRLAVQERMQARRDAQSAESIKTTELYPQNAELEYRQTVENQGRLLEMQAKVNQARDIISEQPNRRWGMVEEERQKSNLAYQELNKLAEDTAGLNKITEERNFINTLDRSVRNQEQLRRVNELVDQKKSNEAYRLLNEMPEEGLGLNRITEERNFRQTLDRVAKGINEGEVTRQANVNREIKNLELGVQRAGREPLGENLTKSEAMRINALNDLTEARAGFVGREPVTLPMGMIQETPQGLKPVIVERFNSGDAQLRGGYGVVSRASLREPENELETRILNQVLIKENVGLTPSRERALEILDNRVNAEQLKRTADAQALRPDFTENSTAQLQEFNLRREAANRLLVATNKDFMPQTIESFKQIQPLVDERIISSVDNIPFIDANDVSQALKGAGFENVRNALNREGQIDIAFTRGNNELEQTVSQLSSKASSYRGVFDPVNRTYEGLTPDEHSLLGRAYGIKEKEIEKFNQFVKETINDMVSRGIRAPSDAATLGVTDIQSQVAKPTGRKKAVKNAQALAPEAIINSEAMQRFEVGDHVKIPVGGEVGNYRVALMIVNPNTGERGLVLQSVDQATVGNQLAPMNDAQLKSLGATRDITKEIGLEPIRPMNIESPARTLEGLLNPEARPVLPEPIRMVRSEVISAAKAMDINLRIDYNKGIYTFSKNGIKAEFNNIEEATRFVNGMKFASEEKIKIINQIGGQKCI